MSLLQGMTWPASRLPELLEALALKSGVLDGPPERAFSGRLPGDDEPDYEPWLERTAGHLGLEAVRLQVRLDRLSEAVLRLRCAVFLLWLPEGPRFIGLSSANRKWAEVVAPGDGGRKVSTTLLCEALAEPWLQETSRSLQPLFQRLDLSEAEQRRCAEGILGLQPESASMGGIWTLHVVPETDFLRQLRQQGILRRLLYFGLFSGVLYVLSTAAWWVIGRGALEGRIALGWVQAWVLFLLTLVPLRAVVAWQAATVSLGSGVLLRRRLLSGALRLDPDWVRRQGPGQVLGRVFDVEFIESFALAGGLVGLSALFEMVLAGFVLGAGVLPLGHVLLLVGFLAGSVGLLLHYALAATRHTHLRLGMTEDLIESLAGHRTRLAQQSPWTWHRHEDESLSAYLAASRSMDDRWVRCVAALPRFWMMFSLVLLAVSMGSGRASTGAAATSLGGILLAAQALRSWTSGLLDWIDVSIAWRNLGPLDRGHRVSLQTGHAGGATPGVPGSLLLEARGLRFRHPAQQSPVFAELGLRIHEGDRLLLEGPSGAGKSTLAAVLSGRLVAEAGLLLLGGFDRGSLGVEAWRQRVSLAPQAQENHILSGPLAFNLLLGRRWPPLPEDLQDAAEVCRELGLEPLLQRMPSGLMQIVGDTGWQLSDGEKARVFLARALLQDAEVVLLDESLGALDAETTQQVLRCARRRCRALLVIAHP